MVKEKYQTRLDEVDAERVDEFQDELGISTKAEATRRLVRRGLDEHERDDSDDSAEETDSDRQLATDGGSGVARQFFSQSATLYSVIVVLTAVPLSLSPLGVTVPFYGVLYGFMATGIVLFVACSALLYTAVPEKIDAAIEARTPAVEHGTPRRGDA
jgi:hypothetical protein